MSGILFTLTLCLLASFSFGESDARIQSKLQRIQSKLIPPRPIRPAVSKAVPDKSSRRTFVTALLAAEVVYLESLLSQQNSKGSKKKPRSKPTKPVHNHIHVPKRVKYQYRHPTPTYTTPTTTTTKYVSKLDPFYMLAAPDLSVKSESYKAPEALAVAPYKAQVKRVEVEVSPYSAPLPTYREYEEYKVPAAAPVTTKPTAKPTAKPYKSTTTTLQYGDFELYQPKGYLPPPTNKPAKQTTHTATALPTYKARAPPAHKASSRPAYKANDPAPTYKKQEPVPVTYRPSTGYLPPVKKTQPAYKKPAPTAYKAPSRKTYKASAPALKYKKPEPAPVTYRPSKVYLPPVKQTPPAYKAPALSPPKYETTNEPPNYEDPPTNDTPVEPTKYKAPVEAPSYEAPAPAPTYIPPSAPKKTNPNPHPHTFFHDEQAKKVHKGDWPPIYYNSLHGDQNKGRRI